MGKDRRTRLGIGVLLAYAVSVMVASAILYEIGARPFGYVSLSGMLFVPSVEPAAEAQRTGRMWVQADRPSECHEYTLDNTKQKIVPVGTVICDQQRYEEHSTGARLQAIRDAFRRQQGSN